MSENRTSTPIPRKDAFFGMHFDLHPRAEDTGTAVRPQVVSSPTTRWGDDRGVHT